MKPPATGRSFEEALEHWSSPDDYERYRQDFERRRFRIVGAGEPIASSEAIELAIFRRLRSGDLLSSALPKRDCPADARFLVPPDTYSGPLLAYDWMQRCVRGGAVELYEVEVFSPLRIPTNVGELPEWVSKSYQQSEARLVAVNSGIDRFRHDEDYAHVGIDETEFLLTSKQAKIVKCLHQAAARGQPWMHLEEIRAVVGFETAKISGLFRRMDNWKALIRSDGRGSYRLNI